jgi:hypothetical protein
MINNDDWRPRGMKAIVVVVEEYTGIDTMEGSLPMRRYVLTSWIHPSAVTVIGIMVPVSLELVMGHATM